MKVIEVVSVIICFYNINCLSTFKKCKPKLNPDMLTDRNQKKHSEKATFCRTHQIASDKGKHILKGLQEENLLHVASTHVAISYAAHSFSLV